MIRITDTVWIAPGSIDAIEYLGDALVVTVRGEERTYPFSSLHRSLNVTTLPARVKFTQRTIDPFLLDDLRDALVESWGRSGYPPDSDALLARIAEECALYEDE